uniref:Serine/arginine repetitive matrix protein 2 n=1 Tax=Timema bartmani TaxID=61472 RepID=A0A7R9EP12_9NEOP|nr:unnamed protein product [Timema bartmani]
MWRLPSSILVSPFPFPTVGGGNEGVSGLIQQGMLRGVQYHATPQRDCAVYLFHPLLPLSLSNMFAASRRTDSAKRPSPHAGLLAMLYPGDGAVSVGGGTSRRPRVDERVLFERLWRGTFRAIAAEQQAAGVRGRGFGTRGVPPPPPCCCHCAHQVLPPAIPNLQICLVTPRDSHRTLRSVVSVRETHQIAEAQQEKNAKLREAFGISEYFVEGSSLDPQRHVKEAQAKAAAEQNKNYMLVRTPSPTPAHTEQAADKSSKRKRHTKDSSSSPEAKREKKKKSKKHKKDRSESPKHSKKKSSSSKDKKKEKDRHKRQRSSSSSVQTVSSSDDSDSSKVSVSGDGRKHHKKRDKNKRTSIPLKESEKTDKRSRAEVNLVEGAGQ